MFGLLVLVSVSKLAPRSIILVPRSTSTVPGNNSVNVSDELKKLEVALESAFKTLVRRTCNDDFCFRTILSLLPTKFKILCVLVVLAWFDFIYTGDSSCVRGATVTAAIFFVWLS